MLVTAFPIVYPAFPPWLRPTFYPTLAGAYFLSPNNFIFVLRHPSHHLLDEVDGIHHCAACWILTWKPTDKSRWLCGFWIPTKIICNLRFYYNDWMIANWVDYYYRLHHSILQYGVGTPVTGSKFRSAPAYFVTIVCAFLFAVGLPVLSKPIMFADSTAMATDFCFWLTIWLYVLWQLRMFVVLVALWSASFIPLEQCGSCWPIITMAAFGSHLVFLAWIHPGRYLTPIYLIIRLVVAHPINK